MRFIPRFCREKTESEKWELGYRPTENGTALVGRLVADGKNTR